MSEKEVVQPVAERKCTMGRRLCKITLCTLALLFVFCLGFILGVLGVMWSADQTDQTCQIDQIDDIDQTDEMEQRPSALVGAFVVSANKDSSKFTVREKTSILPIIEWENQEQPGRRYLVLNSSLEKDEKDWLFLRFHARLAYTGGNYEGGIFAFQGKDRARRRTYFDSKGTGVLDIMDVYENGVMSRHKLNGLSWEKVEEIPYDPESKIMKAYEAIKKLFGTEQTP
jgi:hypothetical protein